MSELIKHIICKVCGDEKPANRFYYDSRRHTVQQPCKECCKKVQKERYAAKKEAGLPYKSFKNPISAVYTSVRQLTAFLKNLHDLEDGISPFIYHRNEGSAKEVEPTVRAPQRHNLREQPLDIIKNEPIRIVRRDPNKLDPGEEFIREHTGVLEVRTILRVAPPDVKDKPVPIPEKIEYRIKKHGTVWFVGCVKDGQWRTIYICYTVEEAQEREDYLIKRQNILHNG